MFRRKVQLSVQPLLAEFQAAYRELVLKLPTTTDKLDRQVERILTTRQRLIKLQLQIQRYLMREIPSQMRQQLHTLLHSSRDLLRIADSLLLLAEEYPLDSEGSIACLQRINRRKATLLQQVQRSFAAIQVGAIAKGY